MIDSRHVKMSAPGVLVHFGQAFAIYGGGGVVLVSGDTRNSGKMVAPCVGS